MTNIAIIGAGQLGSRHLQALAMLNAETSIQVVDPSDESLKTAENRFNEVNKNFQGKVSFHHLIEEIEKKLDVAIIATNSKIRRAVIEQLLDHSEVNALVLEKFLFTKAEDYIFIGSLLKKENVKTWVNCPRRMMDVYKELRKEISGTIHFSISGNAWGIGCNGIHLLDLFAFLTGSSDISLSNHLLDKTILESKRKGYIEFTGTITGETSRDSFRMTSFPGELSDIFISIDTPTARYLIEESTGKLKIASEKNKWQWEERNFVMPYQSQLTNILVEQIIETGNCDLPTYKESAALHLLLLENFISFMRKVNNDNSINECPIT